MCRPTYRGRHDFRPICSPRERVPCSAPEVTPMPQSRLIGTIGLVTWLLVALPALLYHVPPGAMLGAGGHAHAAVETHRHHRARDVAAGGVARAALSRARAPASRALHRLALD